MPITTAESAGPLACPDVCGLSVTVGHGKVTAIVARPVSGPTGA